MPGIDTNLFNPEVDEDTPAPMLMEGIEKTFSILNQHEKFSTQVLDDSFHYMDRLLRLLSKKHSVHKAFAHDFSEAIFIRDKTDVEAVKAVLEKHGVSWEYAKRAKAPALNRRIRRYIPEGTVLLERLQKLFTGYENMQCSTKKGHVRISPATAKFKSPPAEFAQLDSFPTILSATVPFPVPTPSVTPSTNANATSAPNANGFPSSVSTLSVFVVNQPQQQQVATVSVPIAGPYYGAEGYMPPGQQKHEYFAQQFGGQQGLQPGLPAQGQQLAPAPVLGQTQVEEWKHHGHTRVILGNLIGPNGEQLTCTDPYNTTVFVKVPVWKCCGFVQFVLKVDAERAIDRMQGFPVGGSKIRLSWGQTFTDAHPQTRSHKQLLKQHRQPRFRSLLHLTSQYDHAAAEARDAELHKVPRAHAQRVRSARERRRRVRCASAGVKSGGFQAASPSNSDVNSAGNAPQPHFTDKDLKVRHEEDPFGYPNQRGQQGQQEHRGLYTTAGLLGTQRDSHSAGLPHPSKAYAPGWPVGGSGSARIPVGGGAGSPMRGYGGGGSPPAFQINRYQRHSNPQVQPISRPNSGSVRSSGGRDPEREREKFKWMHDLRLELDREREWTVGDHPWSLKTPILESASEESTSSGGSVQFRVTMGRTLWP
ncbi:hypothetical protein B0H13DRAFT_2306681 [Mycena leptocephala]|nr:hypothetical protein B0H13DRAFT_2306681 [Mycena leptocephala]